MARCAPGCRRAREPRRAAARRSRRRPSAEDAMDRIAEWRPVESTGPDGPVGSADGQTPAPRPDEPRPGLSPRLITAVMVALTVAICAVAGVVALIVLAAAPKPAVAIDTKAPAASSVPSGSGATPTGRPAAEVIVDVEGAVNQSGVFRLAGGSRLGDAITAAGGYSAQVDIG